MEASPPGDPGADLIEKFYAESDDTRRNEIIQELFRLFDRKLRAVFEGHSLKITTEEGVQETWLRVVMTHSKPNARYRRELGRFQSWLLTIARRVRTDNAILTPPSDAALLQCLANFQRQIRQRYFSKLVCFFLRELRRQKGGSPMRRAAEKLAEETLASAFRRAAEFDPEKKQFIVWLKELAEERLPEAKGPVSEHLPAVGVSARADNDPVADETAERVLDSMQLQRWDQLVSGGGVCRAIDEFLKSLSARVAGAFRELSPMQQKALFLVGVLEMEVKEAAEKLGTSPQVIYNALSQGRKRMEEVAELGGWHAHERD